MEFFLHNEEGIQFPPIRPSFKTGDRYFGRFCCLIPRDQDSSILGEGGAGVVHLARDEVMDRLIALKLLSKELQRDPMARLDVIRETRQAMDLTHPNIVRIHDFHEGKEGWGISMQYIKGLDLDKWRIENNSGTSSIIPYPVERIENWVRQLCDALAYAHDDALMVHRDIKPRNLMLERRDNGSEKLYLTDFGITKKLATHTLMVSKVQPAAKDEKAALGTLPYMSWQQLEDEAPTIYDDIYSVGATIYDLITGRPPFYEGSYDQIRHQIEKGTPPSMEARLEAFSLPNLGIPKAWEEVVRDCLLKDPKERPTSVRQISERLGLTKSAPVTVVTKEITPVGNPVREAELERELAVKLAEISRITEERDQSLAERNAEIARLTEEKERDLASKDAEVLRLVEEKERDLAGKQAEVLRLTEEKEHDLAKKNAEVQRLIEEKDLALAAREAELTQLAAEKDELVQSLTGELEHLKESIASGDEASTLLQTELNLLSQTMAKKEEAALSLQAQLEEIRKNAQLEGDEAVNALQATLQQKDAEITQLRGASETQQAQLAESVRNSELEKARLAELEAKLESTRSQSAGASDEIEQIRTRASQQQAELEEARRISEQEKAQLVELKSQLEATQAEHAESVRNSELKKARLAELEAELESTRSQSAGASDEIEQIRASASQQQAELEEARRISEQEKAKLIELKSQLKATQAEHAGAAIQIEKSRTEAATAVADKENSVAKARQLTEKSEARLNELKQRQSAPLMPLIVTLLGSFVVGLGGGAVAGKFLPGSDPVAAQIATIDFAEIPNSEKPVGNLVSAGLFRQFALSSGVLESDLDKLVPNLSSFEDSDPVRGVTYPIAESFCAWLTARDPLGAIGDGGLGFYRIPQMDELQGVADATIPEWSSSPSAEAGEVDAKMITVGADEKENPWLVRSWRTTLGSKAPLSFRLIFDDGKP